MQRTSSTKSATGDSFAKAQLNNNAAQMASLDDSLTLNGPARGLPEADRGVWPTATKRHVLTVMFVDIRGSSKIEEALSPELTVEFLNIYLGLAAQAILANHGGVNQFIGDGILATFGLLDEPDHGASNAFAAAAAIHRSFESAKGQTAYAEKVRAVVAIHTGTAIVHAIGRAEQSHYSVLGAAVNIASRLEYEGKELGLTTVMSGSTVAALNGGAGSLRLVTRKKLRGLSDRIEVWSPDSSAPTAPSVAVPRPSPPSDASYASSLDWRQLAAGTLVAGVYIASLIMILGLRADLQFTSTLMSVAQIGAALGATATCGWTASRSHLHRRRGWGLIAASTAMWALGQTEASVLGSGVGLMSPGAWLANLSFLLSLGFAIAGVMCFWTTPLGPFDRLRAALDGLIVGTSLAFAMWTFGIDHVPVWFGTSFTELAGEVQFSIGEIALGTAVILVINRGARHLQAPLLLMLASVAVAASAAVFGAYKTGTSNGGVYVADAGLLLALLLIALAPLWPVRPPVRKPAVSVDVWELALPWMAVTLATLGGISLVVRGRGLDPFLTGLSAVLVGFMAASQFLAHRDSLNSLHETATSEKTLADVIGHAPVGIARVNAELRVVAANPTLAVLLREPLEAITASAITRYLAPEIQPELRAGLERLAAGEAQFYESDLPMQRADGSPAWMHVATTAVRKSTGQVDYFIVMMQDTTARHEAEQTSKTALAEMERLNQVKTEFLQSISHEFKTALIGIDGFSELMQESTEVNTDELREFAEEIHGGAERLSRMVAEFLDLDHAANGPASMLIGSVDVNGVIRRAIEEVKRGTDGLEFKALLDPELPAMTGDEGKLAQLVTLLLGDAARYSPDGGQVTVATRTHVGQLEVSVMDQGVAMRADFDNPLFNRDDLYAGNPIRRVVGTGLGLGIARQIVALHGGRIWMDRLDGIGSEAHVTFPLDMTIANGSGRSRTAGVTTA